MNIQTSSFYPGPAGDCFGRLPQHPHGTLAGLYSRDTPAPPAADTREFYFGRVIHHQARVVSLQLVVTLIAAAADVDLGLAAKVTVDGAGVGPSPKPLPPSIVLLEIALPDVLWWLRLYAPVLVVSYLMINQPETSGLASRAENVAACRIVHEEPREVDLAPGIDLGAELVVVVSGIAGRFRPLDHQIQEPRGGVVGLAGSGPAEGVDRADFECAVEASRGASTGMAAARPELQQPGRTVSAGRYRAGLRSEVLAAYWRSWHCW